MCNFPKDGTKFSTGVTKFSAKVTGSDSTAGTRCVLGASLEVFILGKTLVELVK
jgi:hypothetical protein